MLYSHQNGGVIMKKLENTIRVNSRVSLDANAWLDKRSIESGISKSSLIQFAIEAYIKNETEQVDTDIAKILKEMNMKLNELQMRIKD